MIEIKFNSVGVKKYLDNLSKNTDKALASALNKTAAQTFTQAKRELTSKYTIKASDVSRVIKITRATTERLTAFIKAVDSQLGFSNVASKIKSAKWKATKLKSGAKTEIKKGNSVRWKKAFIAKMPSGHIGLFERTGKKRLSIREIKGPSISYLFKSSGIANNLISFANRKLKEIFKHELEYFNKK